jgi:SAM-dependent methyltransferase
MSVATAKAGVQLRFDQGFSTALPYPDATFDLALSSLFFHHLARDDKAKTFTELFRVVRPGGALHVADWGRARNPLMRAAFLGIQLLDGFTTTADNVRGELPRLMTQAGFIEVEETVTFSTLFGTMSLYRARRPR